MNDKDKLSAKIVSDAQLVEATSCMYVPATIYPHKLVTPATMYLSNYDQIGMAYPWWLKREYLRIHLKVYQEPTEVIKYLNKARPEFALHVSKEDKNYIAYTPDRVSGESDRQLRTTLGRYLAKVWPHLPESMAQDMVTEHMAELSDEFELLYGQDVVDVYKNVQGPTSCMLKFEWDAHDQHPAMVYDAEGIGMAVLRDKDGRIVTRALVYHASEDDKRYIRVYTDAKLTKRLQRAGYKAGTWHGAKFKTILANTQMPNRNIGAGTYVFPYLDGNGSAGSASTSSVACIDGVITGITAESAVKLNEQFGRIVTATATNTSGTINLTDVSSASFTKTCALTGTKLNVLVDAIVPYWDGFQMLDIASHAVSEFGLAHITHSSYMSSEKRVWVSDNVPTFQRGSRTWLDSVANRKYCDFYKLSEKYYGPDQPWIFNTSEMVLLDREENTLIRSADAIEVIELNSENAPRTVVKHKSELDYTWTKVHAETKGRPMYAVEGVKVVKTLTGRKVVEGIHNISRLWDDTWDFVRNVANTYRYETYYNYNKKNRPNFDAGGPIWDMQVEAKFGDGIPSNHDLCTLAAEVMSYGINTIGRTIRVQGATWNQITDPAHMNYLAELCANEHVKALLYRVAVFKAAAEAVDYSAATNLQGAAGSTWTPPPETPDCNGRTGYGAKLYKHLMELPLATTGTPLELIANHGWVAEDLAANLRLRVNGVAFERAYREATGDRNTDATYTVIEDAYAKRKAYYAKLCAFVEAHRRNITDIGRDSVSFDGDASEQWAICLAEAYDELWAPVIRETATTQAPVPVTQVVGTYTTGTSHTTILNSVYVPASMTSTTTF